MAFMADGYAGPRQLRQLFDAITSLGSELDIHVVLRRIVVAATELVHATYGALGVLDEAGTGLSNFLTVGVTDDQIREIGPLPKGHGILGLLIVDPRPLRLPDLHEHPDSFGFPLQHPPMQSFLGVPIKIRDRVFGNLYLTDKRDGDVFTDVDEELVVALATSAGVAIENTRLHTRLAEVALLEDRERIARDLHDTVIQRLFATGLMLQAGHRLAIVPEVADRIERAVNNIDEVIRDIRTSVFQLHTPTSSAPSVRRDVLDICHEASRLLGFDPAVRFAGAVDLMVTPDTAFHVVQMLREALANTARHAHATRVEVDVNVTEDNTAMTFEVADNGTGFDTDTRRIGYGLDNMKTRANELGGSLTIDSGAEGTSVRVWLPLPASGPPARS
jgi:signal transduction histidine kinase